MTERRQRLGRTSEDLVAERLSAAGWRVLARNARSRHGELDIVALDGRTLVFVEVKAGQVGATHGPVRPVHAIHARKQSQVRRLASAWMAEHRDLPRYTAIRFDAVGVSFDRAGRLVEIEHIPNAF